MASYMPTIFPFHSRLFINKTILFRRLSSIITQVFYFPEYIGDLEKARLFCWSFNQTETIKQQIVWPILVPTMSTQYTFAKYSINNSLNNFKLILPKMLKTPGWKQKLGCLWKSVIDALNTFSNKKYVYTR